MNIKFNGLDRIYDNFSWRITRRAKAVWKSGKVISSSHVKDSYLDIFEKAVGYLEVHDEKYFITTGNGQFYYGNLNDLENNELILFPISHNFEKVIDFKNLKEIYKKNIPYSNAIAIKDTLIHDNHIYVSLVDEIKNNCFMTSILKANINDNFSLLNFEYFFKPDFCLLSKDNTALIISGGALSINPNKNELYLSVGDYRHWDKVNLKKKSILGKTLLRR